MPEHNRMKPEKRIRRSIFITARIPPDLDMKIRDIAKNAFGGNYNEALIHILRLYLWFEIMLQRFIDQMDILEELKETKDSTKMT